jgi:hypothetical protein
VTHSSIFCLDDPGRHNNFFNPILAESRSIDVRVYFIVQLAKETKNIVKVFAVDILATPPNNCRVHASVMWART